MCMARLTPMHTSHTHARATHNIFVACQQALQCEYMCCCSVPVGSRQPHTCAPVRARHCTRRARPLQPRVALLTLTATITTTITIGLNPAWQHHADAAWVVGMEGKAIAVTRNVRLVADRKNGFETCVSVTCKRLQKQFHLGMTSRALAPRCVVEVACDHCTCNGAKSNTPIRGS